MYVHSVPDNKYVRISTPVCSFFPDVGNRIREAVRLKEGIKPQVQRAFPHFAAFAVQVAEFEARNASNRPQ